MTASTQKAWSDMDFFKIEIHSRTENVDRNQSNNPTRQIKRYPGEATNYPPPPPLLSQHSAFKVVNFQPLNHLKLLKDNHHILETKISYWHHKTTLCRLWLLNIETVQRVFLLRLKFGVRNNMENRNAWDFLNKFSAYNATATEFSPLMYK